MKSSLLYRQFPWYQKDQTSYNNVKNMDTFYLLDQKAVFHTLKIIKILHILLLFVHMMSSEFKL